MERQGEYGHRAVALSEHDALLRFRIINMKTQALCGWMAVCASVLTLTAFASAADQATTATKPDKTYTGTIIAVNPNQSTLTVKGLLLSKNFNLGENCSYVLWNKPAGAMTDLRAGEKVKVAYQDASGVLVADRIQQEPMTEQGMVKSIDPAAHTLTLHAGWVDKTIQIPDNCLVTLSGGKTGSFADVQPGYYVMVTYEVPNDKPVAREIEQTGTTFTGELRAVNLNDQTVVAKSLFGTDTFHLADNCAIVINGKLDGQLSDLKLGERMTFNYEDVNGVKIVNRIANETTTQESETTSAQPVYP
jgi:Cu/Ag efflux protein CusF